MPETTGGANEEPHAHEEEHGDPRWAVLEALRQDLP